MMLRVCAIVMLSVLAASCTRPGRSVASDIQMVTGADGSAELYVDGTLAATLGPNSKYSDAKSEAQQPNPPNTSAGSEAGNASSWTGEAAAILQSLSGSFWFMVIGSIIAIAGGVVMVAKRSGAVWAAPAPVGTGMVMIVGGGCMAVLPYFLERWGWLLAVAAVIAVIPWLIKWWRNAGWTYEPA